MPYFEDLGLSLSVSDPLVKTDRSSLVVELTNRIEDYSQELRREGGMFSASINMNLSEEDINDWVQNGIGQHVEVHNPGHELIGEWFANQLDVKTGEDTFSVGPLIEIGNRISVTYSTIDTSTNPPILGIRATTAVANNAISQAKYGIWHKIKSINGATAADAIQMRDMFRDDPTRAYPVTSGELTLSGSGPFAITINLLGYWHWLAAYYYDNSVTGDINLSQKIQDAIAASPNAVFSTDYSKIATNTSQVADYASGEQTALSIIKDMNSRGDGSYSPYSVGIYAGRRIVYKAVPTTINYQRRRGQPVQDQLEGKIKPWDVDPVEWIFRPDFLVGRNPPITAATLGSDPRAYLIETVKYSTAYGLSINGRKLSNLDQVLARRGIGGMS